MRGRGQETLNEQLVRQAHAAGGSVEPPPPPPPPAPGATLKRGLPGWRYVWSRNLSRVATACAALFLLMNFTGLGEASAWLWVPLVLGGVAYVTARAFVGTLGGVPARPRGNVQVSGHVAGVGLPPPPRRASIGSRPPPPRRASIRRWPAERIRQVAGSVVLGIGVICLLLGGAFTLWGIVDYNGSESLTATVVSIDGGECRYSWAGPPAPAEGDSADTCPRV